MAKTPVAILGATGARRVRPCPLLDLRTVVVVHNKLRCAAGGSDLNAEWLAAGGYIKGYVK